MQSVFTAGHLNKQFMLSSLLKSTMVASLLGTELIISKLQDWSPNRDIATLVAILFLHSLQEVELLVNSEVKLQHHMVG